MVKANSSNVILELKDITKTFLGGKIIANDSINLSFKKGEIHSLIGENGSGKSTLMNIIFGLYKQDKGDIFVYDKKVDMYLTGAAKHHKIGMVHQHFHLINEFNVLENIILGQEKPKIDADLQLIINQKNTELSAAVKELKSLQEKSHYSFLNLRLMILKEQKLYNLNQQIVALKSKILINQQKLSELNFRKKQGLVVESKLNFYNNQLTINEKKLNDLVEKEKLQATKFTDFKANNKTETSIFLKYLDVKILKNIIKSYYVSNHGIINYNSANKRFEFLKQKYGIELDSFLKIKNLSIGKRQMVEILKVLWEDKDLIVFDEPTATLSIVEIEILMKTIHLLKKEGKTIIFISHKLEEVKQLSDRISILKKGLLMGTYINNEQLTAKKIAKEMVGKEINLDYPMRTIAKKPILSVKNLSYKTSSGFEAVRNVNFEVYENEIFGLAGIEGNGQEEIINVIAGLKMPSSGTIKFNDKILNKFPEILPVRKRISFISYIPIDRKRHGIIADESLNFNSMITTFETKRFSKLWIKKLDEKNNKLWLNLKSEESELKNSIKKVESKLTNLLDKLSVNEQVVIKKSKNFKNQALELKLIKDNLAKLKLQQDKFLAKNPGRSLLIDKNLAEPWTTKIIKEFQVDGAYNNLLPIKNLSGGNQQKFVVGREMLRNHELLIAGHPTRGLDILAIDHIYKKILTNEKTKATLLYSLEINELIAVCDRIAIIFKGQIIDIINPKTTELTLISKMMIGEK